MSEWELVLCVSACMLCICVCVCVRFYVCEFSVENKNSMIMPVKCLVGNRSECFRVKVYIYCRCCCYCLLALSGHNLWTYQFHCHTIGIRSPQILELAHIHSLTYKRASARKRKHMEHTFDSLFCIHFTFLLISWLLTTFSHTHLLVYESSCRIQWWM